VVVVLLLVELLLMRVAVRLLSIKGPEDRTFERSRRELEKKASLIIRDS
jgi:hypothetical protein